MRLEYGEIKGRLEGRHEQSSGQRWELVRLHASVHWKAKDAGWELLPGPVERTHDDVGGGALYTWPTVRVIPTCRCDFLGQGTPEHETSPLCRWLRPDADRDV